MRVSKLKNAPEWLKKATVNNENVKIVNGVVHWMSGEWLSGDFCGDFRGGDFFGGNFCGERFLGGNFLDGNFWDGDLMGGNIIGGHFRGEKIISSGSLAPAKSSGRAIFWIISKSHQYVRAGCFSGTIAELRNKAKLEHSGQNLAWYESACNAIEMMIKAGE